MIKTWPHIHSDGWHLEAGWTWNSFGIVVNVVWREAFVVRIGWAYVMLWRHEDLAPTNTVLY